MLIDSKQVCNVCLTVANNVDKVVFITAHCRGEEVHICTGCIPSVIHGSGEVVKSNEEVTKAVSNS